jgi:hypothetical protein
LPKPSLDVVEYSSSLLPLICSSCAVVVLSVCVGYASFSVAVDVLAAPPPGAVVALSLTFTETVADVVDVGCGHGALCTYVCESDPVYAKVSPEAIGRGAAIAFRDATAMNGVCPTHP